MALASKASDELFMDDEIAATLTALEQVSAAELLAHGSHCMCIRNLSHVARCPFVVT